MDTYSANATVLQCLSKASYVQSSPSPGFTINGIISCVVNLILAIIGPFVNSLVIVAFYKSPNLRTKTSFFLVMVLSITDLAVCLFVHPMFIVMMVKQLAGTGDCISKTVYLTSTTLLPGLSGGTLFVMNIERYLAIVHPFVYERYVTKRNLILATLVLWLLWIPITIIAFFDTKLQSILMLFYTTAVCLTTVLVYVKIFQIARQKRRHLTPKPPMPRTDNSLQDSVIIDLYCNQACAESKRAKLTEFIKDVKLAKTFILIVVCSLVCYFPSIIFDVYLYLDKGTAVTPLPMMMAGAWVLTFITMNSTLNSLIFCWRNSQLRNEMLRIGKCR